MEFYDDDFLLNVQWELENSGIERRLLQSCYDFK